jgi:hypothetical protein
VELSFAHVNQVMPVHLRLNDKDTSRNPYINFVTALPGPRHDEALRRLQQLAAMARPLMHDQSFHINSLEEYEWNREFAGRCWNNGEVIELVLTSAKGEWMPLQYVLFVFCHELAHIKHMNHIPRLHGALTRHLKELALSKQRQGYYGDGLWSAGRSLASGSSVPGLGMRQGLDGLPDHVCGGAFSHVRRGSKRIRSNRRAGGGGKRTFRGPSLHTGPQTAANTRGGNRRVKLETAGQGSRVDGRNDLPTASAKDSSYKQDVNSTFRKRTQTKDARQIRAMAAQSRFAAAAMERYVAAKQEEDDKKSDEAVAKGAVRTNESTTDEESDQGEEGESGTNERDSIPVTQAWHESSEERRNRTQQYYADMDEEERQIGNDEWDDLLNDECGVQVSGEEERTDVSGPASGKRKSIEILTIDDDDDDDDGEEKGGPQPLSAQDLHWTCQLCTLHNPTSRSRCGACDTSRGKTTLGA